jgi:hypothetical protein
MAFIAMILFICCFFGTIAVVIYLIVKLIQTYVPKPKNNCNKSSNTSRNVNNNRGVIRDVNTNDTEYCSAKCGDGIKIVKAVCMDPSGNVVDDLYCKDQVKPDGIEKCNLRPCDPWKVGDWSQCSLPCGPGVMTRDVTCPSNQCDDVQPPATQNCNNGVCDWSKNDYYTNRELLNGKWLDKQEYHYTEVIFDKDAGTVSVKTDLDLYPYVGQLPSDLKTPFTVSPLNASGQNAFDMKWNKIIVKNFLDKNRISIDYETMYDGRIGTGSNILTRV